MVTPTYRGKAKVISIPPAGQYTVEDEIPQIEEFLSRCAVDHVTFRKENLGFNSPETTIADNVATNKSGCFWLYLGMMIRPDGAVYPCCGRGFDRFSYGNLLDQDLSEIWNNKYYRFSRALFSSNQDLPYDEGMARIPCLSYDQFKKRCRMPPK